MDKIFVVTHKAPNNHLIDGWEYISVGSNYFNDELNDRSGNSIYERNSEYSELTALYWIWKNFSSNPDNFIGIMHYRRFLTGESLINTLLKSKVNAVKIIDHLENYDIIAPIKNRVYPNAYVHYTSEHIGSDLDLAISIAESNDSVPPGHYKELILNIKSAHLFNIFITKKSILDSYSNWLFRILFEVETKLDLTTRDAYQRRVFGFLSERLFNLWLITNPHLKVKSLPLYFDGYSRFKNWNRNRLCKRDEKNYL
jgi:hypothetical protein